MVIKINDIIDNNDKYYNLMIENIHKLKNDFYQNPTFNLWEKIKLTIKENEN